MLRGPWVQPVPVLLSPLLAPTAAETALCPLQPDSLTGHHPMMVAAMGRHPVQARTVRTPRAETRRGPQLAHHRCPARSQPCTPGPHFFIFKQCRQTLCFSQVIAWVRVLLSRARTTAGGGVTVRRSVRFPAVVVGEGLWLLSLEENQKGQRWMPAGLSESRDRKAGPAGGASVLVSRSEVLGQRCQLLPFFTRSGWFCPQTMHCLIETASI